MKAIFTIKEVVINGGGISGRVMYVKDEFGNLKPKTIDYVKDIPKYPMLQIHFTDGTTVQVKEKDEQLWEVNNRKQFKKGYVPRLRGKDIWGTEEVER